MRAAVSCFGMDARAFNAGSVALMRAAVSYFGMDAKAFSPGLVAAIRAATEDALGPATLLDSTTGALIALSADAWCW